MTIENTAAIDTTTQTKYISFVGPDADGFYIIVSMVTREAEGFGPIRKSRQGGRVQHPELIDVYSPIWLTPKCKITGTCRLSGDIVIDSAIINDTDISGKVRIGLEADNFANPNTERPNFKLKIDNSKIVGPEPGDPSRVLTIGGKAYITDSVITGESFVNGNSRIAKSGLSDCYVDNLAWISCSQLDECTVVNHSEVVASCVEKCTLKDDTAAIQTKTAIGLTLTGKQTCIDGCVMESRNYTDQIEA